MSRRAHIETLLRKAAQDELALDLLLQHGAMPEELVGFHAQQAAEKLLKAALRTVGADYPLTHRIERLMDLLAEAGSSTPSDLDELRLLTPFAVEFRYDILPSEAEATLDGHRLRGLIAQLRQWVEALSAPDAEDAEG